MSRPLLARIATGLLASVALPVLALPTLAIAAGPAAADPVSCFNIDPQKPATTTSANVPFGVMQIGEARRDVNAANQVVGVVGVPMVSRNLYLRGLTVAGTTTDQQYDESTSVAGLAAGLVVGRGPQGLIGVAAGARVVGVGVYDPGGENPVATADGIATGISTAVAAGARTVIVAVAASDSSPGLVTAVQQAQSRGVIVVAAVLPPLEDSASSSTPSPSATLTSYPAALAGVLGVGVGTADGVSATGGILPSQDIDVVAPVTGAVVTTANQSLCDVDTSYGTPPAALAAGEVGGLVALLRAKFPADTPAQIVTRITATAAGSRLRDDLDGYGMVQAGEAASRTLDITAAGDLREAVPAVERASAVSPPPAEVDRFAQFRTSLLWWGVLAGGGLVLALIVRPLLRR